jgi:myosin heavy subunit
MVNYILRGILPMKKSMMKLAIPTLALGLTFAPFANAAPEASVQKTQYSVKVDAKVAVKLSAKEKEAGKKLAPITKNIAKVETSVNKLITENRQFYAKVPVTPVYVQLEAEFYKSRSGKLKASANQVSALKKQVDKVAKKYKNTDVLEATYKSLADLTKNIKEAEKALNEFHNQYKAKVKAEESKSQFKTITQNLTKVETNVALLFKTSVDFYTKAATDPTVTVRAEADFYKNTTSKLKANSNQLISLKKQLDQVASNNDPAAVAAANSKIVELTNTIAVVSKQVTDLHNQFKSEESKRELTAIVTNLTKVEVSVAEQLKATVDFYAKAAINPTVTAKAEADFYTKTAATLKANEVQLKTVKKQLDAVATSSQDPATVAAAYKKISDITNNITVTNQHLTDLHNQFKNKAKAEEVQKQLATITDKITKVEVNVAAQTKATVDFYSKATTDSKVTAQVEAAFYTNTSATLLNNIKDLVEIKNQLDAFVKANGQTADTNAAYTKLTSQTKAVTQAVEVLINFHINFKPLVG